MRVAIVVALLTSTAAAEPVPTTAATWCAVNPGEQLPPTATVTWRGRIDADAAEDVIVNLGDCGTSECMHAAYVRCGDGSYSSVFAGYASRIRVQRRAGWARFEVEHVGDRDRRGNRPRSWFRVPFTADGYQE